MDEVCIANTASSPAPNTEWGARGLPMVMCRGNSGELVVGQASSVGKRPTMPAAACLGLVYTCNTNLGTLRVGYQKVPGRGFVLATHDLGHRRPGVTP